MKATRPVRPVISAARLLRAAGSFFVALGWAATAGQGQLTGGTVVAGEASIVTAPNSTTITAGNNSVLQWNSFNIAPSETVRFIQPGAEARVMNWIGGLTPSQINGSLLANGQVYLLNPSGVYFGTSAVVDVGRLYAIGGSMSKEDFFAGRDRFTNLTGAVSNDGSIRGEMVALIGRSVANSGSIISPGGFIGLASGDQVLLGQDGSSIFVDAGKSIPTVAPTEGTGVANTGKIDAGRGTAVLAAGDFYSIAITHDGTLAARNVRVQGQGTGNVLVSGTIDASSTTPGEAGGRIEITGERVGLVSHASIKASGPAGGGTILVGGDFQGKNPDVRNATATYVGQDVFLAADATTNGNGGKVIVWADNTTRSYGAITARGGAQSGDGGFIETSGKRYLEVGVAADASAPHGKAGSWLLDPSNVTITGATANFDTLADTPVAGTTTYSPIEANTAADTATIAVGTINTALNAGTNVIVDTVSAGTAEPGNITVASAISKTAGGNATITLNAAGTITVGSTIGSTVGQLGVTLTAGGTVAVGGAITTNGGNFQSSGTTFTNAGGAIDTRSSATVGGHVDILHSSTVAIAAAVTTGSGHFLSNGGTTFSNAGGAITTTGGNVDILHSTTVAVAAAVATGGGNFQSTGSTFTNAGGSINTSSNATTGGTLTIDQSATVSLSAALTTKGGDVLIKVGDTFADTTTIDAGLIKTVTIQPTLATGTLSVGDASSGTLKITSAEIAAITAGNLIIGRSDGTTAINVGTTEAVNFGSKNTTIQQASGGMTVQTNSVTGSGSMTFIAGTGTFTNSVAVNTTGAITITADDVAISANIGNATAGAVRAQQSTIGQTVNVASGAGGLNITAAEVAFLTGSGANTGTLTIGSATGSGVVTIGTAATTLTVAGVTGLTFDGAASHAVTLNGNINLSSASVAPLSIKGAVTLGSDVTLDTSTGGGSISFTGNGTIDGAQALTLTAGTGNITVGGNVGATRLGALMVTSGGVVAFQGTGTQQAATLAVTASTSTTFTGNVNLTGAASAAAGAGNISFLNGLTTGAASSFVNTGTLQLGDNVADSSTINTALTHTAGPTTLGGTITSGAITLGAVTLAGATTLDSTGGGIAIASIAGGAQNLTLAAGIGVGTTTVSGNVTALGSGTGAALTVNNAVTGLVDFQGSLGGISGLSAGAATSLKFGGDVTLADGNTPTILAGNVTLDGLTFSGFDGLTFGALTLSTAAVTLDSNGGSIAITTLAGGSQDLTLQSRAGTTTVTGNVTGVNNLNLHDANAASTGAMTFQGSVTAVDLVTVGRNYTVALEGGGTFTNAVDFLNTGTITLGNDGSDLLTFTGGLDTLSGSGTNVAGTVATTNAQMDLDPTTLTANTTLKSGSGPINIASLAGAFTLSLQDALVASTGTVTVAGDATIAGLTTFGGAAVYNVALNGGGTITNDTTFANTGTITLGNDGSDLLTFTGGLDTLSGSGTNVAGTVATTNTQMDLDPTTLTANTTLKSGSGPINIASLAGAFTLSLQDALVASTGTVMVAGDATIAGLTTFGGAAVYNVALNGGGTITNAVTFLNLGTLTLGDSGIDSTAFTGGVTAIAPSTKSIAGTISAATGVINLGTSGVAVTANTTVGGASTGTISLGAATIADSATLTVGTGAATPISLATVTGANTNATAGTTSNLTINVADDATNPTVSIGNVGTDIGTVTVTQSSGTTFTGTVNAAAVTLTDTRTGQSIRFNGNLTATNLTLAAQGYNVALRGGATITGAVSFLHLGTLILGDDDTDTTTFTGGVEATASSSVSIAGNLATTNTAMTLGAVTLTAATTLNSGGGNITIASINGAQDLTLAAGIGAGTTTVTGNVTNLGDGMGAALTVNNSATGLVDFQGTFSGNSGLSAGVATNVKFGGDVTLANGNTATNLAGNVTLDGLTFSGFDGLTFGAVTLSSGAVSLDSNSYDITFSQTLNGAQTLGLTAGTGNILFSGIVGGGTPLGAVTINAANDVTIGSAFTAASFNQGVSGSGATTVNGVLTTTGGAVTLDAATVDINQNIVSNGGLVTLNAGAGGVDLITAMSITTTAAAGSGTASGAIDINVSGTGTVNLAGNLVTTGASRSVASSGAASAGGQVDITTTDGTIAVAGITTSGGAHTGGAAGDNGGAAAAINITTAGTTRNLTLNGTLTALGGTAAGAGTAGSDGTGVTLTATGAITDGSAGEGAGNENIIGNVVTLTAGTGLGTSSALGDLDTAATQLDLTTGTGGIFIAETDGVQLGNGTGGLDTTTSGDIVVVAGGAITTGNTVTTAGNGNISLSTSAGAITLSDAVTANGAGDVTVNAAGLLTANAAISSGTGNLSLTGGTGVTHGVNGDLTTTLTGTIGVTATANAVTLVDGTIYSTGSGQVDVLAATNVALGQITTTSSAVNVTATAGAITETTALEAANLTTSGTATLVAGNGAIGTSTASGDIDTAIGTLRASATGGTNGIFITEADGLALGNGTSGLSAAGAITVTSGGAITTGNTLVAGGNVTLTTTVGGITLDNTLTTTGGGAVTFTNAGLLTLNANVTSDGAVTQNGAGLVTINTDRTITTTADAVGFASDVTLNSTSGTGLLTINTTSGNAVGNSITFSGKLDGTTDGAEPVTLNAGTGGSIVFTGLVGSTKRLGAINLTSASGVTVTAGLKATTLTQSAGTGTTTFNGAVDTNAAGGISLTGTNLAVNAGVTTTAGGTVTVAESGTANFAVAGDITSDGIVSLTATGGITTAGDVTTTNDNVSYASATSLSGPVVVNAVSSAITFTGTVNGGQALTANSSGTTTFSSAVGGGTALASVTTDTGGTTAINGGAVTTSGAQTYNDVVALNAPGTATTLTGTDVFFAGTVRSVTDGVQALTISGTGTTTFTGAVGDNSQRLASLTTNNGGTTVINGGSVTTLGAQTYADAVTLHATADTTTLTGTDISFGSTLRSMEDADDALIVSGSGTTSFGGAVGDNSQRLATLLSNGGGTTRINGNVTTAGTQTYADNAQIDSGVILATTNSAVAFAGTIDSEASEANNLTINTGSAATTISGVIGSAPNGALGTLTINNTATTGMALPSTNALALSVTTNGPVTDFGNLAITNGATINAGANAITLGDQTKETTNFGSLNVTGSVVTINEDSATVLTGVSASTLTLTSAGSIVDVPGTILNVSSVATFGAGANDINIGGKSGTSTTFGRLQVTGGVVDVTQNNAMIVSGTASVNMQLRGVGVDLAGINTPQLGVYSTGPLGITDSAATNVIGLAVFDAGGYDIVLDETLNDFNNVQLSGATVTFNDSNAYSLAGVLASGPFNARSFGDFAVTAPMTGFSTITLTSITGAVSISAPITSQTGNVGITAPQSITSTAPITTSSPSGTITIRAGGIAQLADLVSAGGSVTVTAGGTSRFTSPMLINGLFTVTSNGITFDSALTGNSTAGDLFANTTGITRFSSSIGASSPLRTLTTNAGGTTVLGNGTLRAVTINFNDAVVIEQTTTITATNLRFGNTLGGASDGGQGLTLNVSSDAVLVGAVGTAGIRLANVTTDAAGRTLINGGAVFTSGTQTYNDPVLLGASTTFTAGDLTFNNTVNTGTASPSPAFAELDGSYRAASTGESDLVANVSGATVFNSPVGLASRVGDVTTDAVGSTTIRADFKATKATFNDAVTFDAATALTIDTTGTQLYASTVQLNTNLAFVSTAASTTEGLTFAQGLTGTGRTLGLTALQGAIFSAGSMGSSSGRFTTVSAAGRNVVVGGDIFAEGDITLSAGTNNSSTQNDFIQFSIPGSTTARNTTLDSTTGNIVLGSGATAGTTAKTEPTLRASIFKSNPGDLYIFAHKVTVQPFERLAVRNGSLIVIADGTGAGDGITLSNTSVSDNLALVGTGLNSSAFTLRSRGPAGVIDQTNATVADNGTDLVGGAVMFFNNTFGTFPTRTQYSPQTGDPAFFNYTLNKGNIPPGFGPLFFTILPDAGGTKINVFVADLVTSNTFRPILPNLAYLDLSTVPGFAQYKDGFIGEEAFGAIPTSDAALRTIVSNGAAPRNSLEQAFTPNVPRGDTDAAPPEADLAAAVREQLQALGIYARALTKEERLARERLAAIFVTVPKKVRPSESDYEVADARVEDRAVREVIRYATETGLIGESQGKLDEVALALASSYEKFQLFLINHNQEKELEQEVIVREYRSWLEASAEPDAIKVLAYLKALRATMKKIEQLGLTRQELEGSKAQIYGSVLRARLNVEPEFFQALVEGGATEKVAVKGEAPAKPAPVHTSSLPAAASAEPVIN